MAPKLRERTSVASAESKPSGPTGTDDLRWTYGRAVRLCQLVDEKRSATGRIKWKEICLIDPFLGKKGSGAITTYYNHIVRDEDKRKLMELLKDSTNQVWKDCGFASREQMLAAKPEWKIQQTAMEGSNADETKVDAHPPSSMVAFTKEWADQLIRSGARRTKRQKVTTSIDLTNKAEDQKDEDETEDEQQPPSRQVVPVDISEDDEPSDEITRALVKEYTLQSQEITMMENEKATVENQIKNLMTGTGVPSPDVLKLQKDIDHLEDQLLDRQQTRNDIVARLTVRMKQQGRKRTMGPKRTIPTLVHECHATCAALQNDIDDKQRAIEAHEQIKQQLCATAPLGQVAESLRPHQQLIADAKKTIQSKEKEQLKYLLQLQHISQDVHSMVMQHK